MCVLVMLVKLSNLYQPSVSGDKTKTNGKNPCKGIYQTKMSPFFLWHRFCVLAHVTRCQSVVWGKETRADPFPLNSLPVRSKNKQLWWRCVILCLPLGNRAVITYGLMPATLFIYIGCGGKHLFWVFVAHMKFVQEKLHLWKYYSDLF